MDNEEDCYFKECYCGKKCKGLRGLKAHQRSCDVLDLPELRSLFQQPFIDELIEREIESSETIEEQIIDNSNLPNSEPLKGLKLSKRKDEWENVNAYFKNNLIMPENIHDIDKTAKEFQKSIYEFFAENYGTHDNSEKGELIPKYADHSKNELRKVLRQLKQDPSSDLTELTYVSRLLRSNLAKQDTPTNLEFDHAQQVKRNFWKYCKNTFESEPKVQPTFDSSTCLNYFKEALQCRNKSRTFAFPEWMTHLQSPHSECDMSPLRYEEVTRAVKRLRSGASSCPFDPVSILILKNCPILRTHLHKTLQYCWETHSVPKTWNTDSLF